MAEISEDTKIAVDQRVSQLKSLREKAVRELAEFQAGVTARTAEIAALDKTITALELDVPKPTPKSMEMGEL